MKPVKGPNVIMGKPALNQQERRVKEVNQCKPCEWHFDCSDKDILVCKKDHVKEHCKMEPITLAEAAGIINHLRFRVMDLEKVLRRAMQGV